MQPVQYPLSRYFSIIALLGLLALVAIVLIAWKLPVFSDAVNSYLKYMSPGTAICLLFLSLASLIKFYSAHLISKLFCLLVLVISIIRLWELTTGMRQLDAVFIWMIGISLDHKEGAMSYLTSICLALTAISIFFSANTQNNQVQLKNGFSLVTSFYVIFLVIVALSGHFLNLMSAFTWMGMRMAPHTAGALLILSAVIFQLNFKQSLDIMYKTSIKQRFLFGAGVLLVFGAVIVVILQQQINYVNTLNNIAISKLTSIETVNIADIQELIKTEYELKEMVLVLTSSFVLICMLLFAGIFLSLTYQLKKLGDLLVDSTELRLIESETIPYLHDKNEFGLIARSIESFVSLNKSQQRLQLKLQKIIESMPNGVIIINSQGFIDLVNEQVCKTFQYTRSELLGKPLEILMPTAVAEKHPAMREAYFISPEARAMGAGRELFGVTKFGKEIALEIGLAPIESDHGIQVLASIVDISEKKLVERNLALSREKVEVTSQALGIGIWEYNPSSNKLIWDDTMLSLYETKAEEFTGQYEYWRSKVHPDDIAEQEKKFLYAIKANTEFVAKFRIVLSDNKIKYIQAKAKVERNEKGNIHIIGTNFDVTREELALQKVQQLDTLRATIVEYSEDAIISKTVTGVLTSWNKGAEKMFGFSAAEAIGKNVKDLLVLAENYREHDDLIEQVRRGNIIRNYASILRCKNDKRIDVSITYSPIKDDQGNIVGVASIKRDISESIKFSARLLAHQKELERSNKSLEAFAYVASHDLKAPLRGIGQLTAWLEEDIRDNNMQSVPETTQKIKVRIKRMETLLDDLLAYSRVEKMQGFYKRIDLNQSVADLFNMNNIKPGMRLQIVNQLPVFETYATPLEQVINNLLSNAIKHHDQPEGMISVSSMDKNEDWYEFSVTDDGPGIDPQFHGRIFNMFQTLRPRDEVEGSGMGLAMVKKIVEQYGGSVGIESQARGCRFYFTWPKLIKKDAYDE